MPNFSFAFPPSVWRLVAFLYSAGPSGVPWKDVPGPVRDFEALRLAEKHKMVEQFVPRPSVRHLEGFRVPLDPNAPIVVKLRCTAYGHTLLADERQRQYAPEQGEGTEARSGTPPADKAGQGEGSGADRAVAPPESFLACPRVTKVFISYAHSSQEHKQAVSGLVATLREKGLAVTADTDVKTPQGPEEGWPRWMKRQIKEANWVLMFFDELYRRRFDGEEEPHKGLGATWEGAIITHHYYRGATKNKKFIPLLADGANPDLIPDELFGYTRYFIPKQTIELATMLRPPLSDSAREHGEENGRAGAAVLPSAGKTEQGETAVAVWKVKRMSKHIAALKQLFFALECLLDSGLQSEGSANEDDPHAGMCPDDLDCESVEPGGEIHNAVCALQPLYGGKLPAPDARNPWRDLQWTCRHEPDPYERQNKAHHYAAELKRWVLGELARLQGTAGGSEPVPTASPKTTPIVFISSTIEDLEEHRAKARDAINQVGFVPRMKEYFAARGDNPPLAVCLEKVSGSRTERPADVLVLIVAHRYGWVPEGEPGSDRKSITWLECEKARENGKEVLAFVVEKDWDWPGRLREENRIAEETARGTATPELLREVQSNVDWLGRFKTWIDKHCSRTTFTTPQSLHGAVFAALYEWQKRHLNNVA